MPKGTKGFVRGAANPSVIYKEAKKAARQQKAGILPACLELLPAAADLARSLKERSNKPCPELAHLAGICAAYDQFDELLHYFASTSKQTKRLKQRLQRWHEKQDAKATAVATASLPAMAPVATANPAPVRGAKTIERLVRAHLREKEKKSQDSLTHSPPPAAACALKSRGGEAASP